MGAEFRASLQTGAFRSGALQTGAIAGLTAAILSAGLIAQAPPANVAIPNPYAITFHDICCAELTRDYSVTQVRFALVVDPATGLETWSGFFESLDLAPAPANGTKPRFDLRLATGLGLDPATESRQASLHMHLT